MSSQASLAGALLGGTYRVGVCLGQGGMGAVYEATHEALGRRVAIKVLLDQGQQLTGEALTRFQREATAAAQLGHPNIIQVTDFRPATDGEPPFIVMERLDGESLEAAIKREGRLQPDRVSRIAQQVLEALIVAHRAGIVHRDIKPANLFLTQIPGVGEVVKVIDFGIAKLKGTATHLTAAGASMGTPLYAAPELLWGTESDERADLYSLGATMYHALTGHPPIVAETLPQFLTLVREQFPAPLHEKVPGIDRDLAQVVLFSLAKEAGSRYPSAVAMRDALRGAAKGSQAPMVNATAPTAALPPLQAVQQASLSPRPHHVATASIAQAPAAFAATGTPQPYTYPSGAPHAITPPSAYPQRSSQSFSTPQTPKKSGAGLWIGLGLGGLLLFLGAGAALWLLVLAPDAKTAVATASSGTASASAAATTAPSSTAGAVPSPTVDPSTGRAVIVIPPASSSRTSPTPPAVPTAPGTPSTPPEPNKPPATGRIKKANCYVSMTGKTYNDTFALKASMSNRTAQYNQCAAKACYISGAKDKFEGGDDYTSANYVVNVDKNGGTGGGVTAQGMPCVPLDFCIKTVVFAMPLPPPVTPGPISVSCSFVREHVN